MIPVGNFQIKHNNKTKKGEQVFVRRSGIAIKWPGGRTGPPRDSLNVIFTGTLYRTNTRRYSYKPIVNILVFYSNPEYTAWDPESETLLDSFTCG